MVVEIRRTYRTPDLNVKVEEGEDDCFWVTVGTEDLWLTEERMESFIALLVTARDGVREA